MRKLNLLALERLADAFQSSEAAIGLLRFAVRTGSAAPAHELAQAIEVSTNVARQLTCTLLKAVGSSKLETDFFQEPFNVTEAT